MLAFFNAQKNPSRHARGAEQTKIDEPGWLNRMHRTLIDDAVNEAIILGFSRRHKEVLIRIQLNLVQEVDRFDQLIHC